MIPNPIRKVLSTFQKHRVRALLMGGQACVLYGAVQFSKDIDFLVLADAENFGRLHAALAELEAARIAVLIGKRWHTAGCVSPSVSWTRLPPTFARASSCT